MNIELLKKIAKNNLILWILFSKLNKACAKYFDVRNCCLPMTISKTINKYGNDKVVNYYAERCPELNLSVKKLRKNIEVRFYPHGSDQNRFGYTWIILAGKFCKTNIYIHGNLKGNEYICITKGYYVDGFLHNYNGPAEITKILCNNEIIVIHTWYKKGKRHNKNGPARIKVSNIYGVKSQKWYIKGKLLKTIKDKQK